MAMRRQAIAPRVCLLPRQGRPTRIVRYSNHCRTLDRVTNDVDAVRALARLSRVLERACSDLSLAHYRVLSAVAGGDERASRVAARLALGKPTISASVDALCRRGLLARDEVAGDQRAVALRLTKAGEQVLADAEQAMTERLCAVLERTTRGKEAAAGLVRMGDGLDDWITERHGATERKNTTERDAAVAERRAARS